MSDSPYFELEFPRPLADLVHACEVFCVAGCCGTDAFDVNASHMTSWMRQQGELAACKAITQLDFLITVASNSLQPLSSNENALNVWWSPADCVSYLGTWHREMERALALAFPKGE